MPTLIAFIVLVLLMVYANYFETDEILLPGAQKPEEILSLSRDKVQTITWKNIDDDGLKIELLSDGGAKIVSPKEYKADLEEVESIFRNISDLHSELVVAETNEGAASFGITDTSLAISIKTEDETVELRLGNKSEVGGSYYLSKVNDPKIYLVSGIVKGAFDKSLDGLRSKQLFSEKFGEIVDIKYQGTDSNIELYKDKQGTWKIAKPINYGADDSVVDAMMAKLEGLRIERFVEDNTEEPEIYGLDKPNISMELTNKEGKRYSFTSGSMTGTDTYATIDGFWVVGLNSLEVGMLKNSLSDFRSKYIELPLLSEVTEVRFKDDSGVIKVEKSGSSWAYEGSKVSNDLIKDFFNSVNRANVKKFDTLTDLEARKLADREAARRFEITAAGVTETWYLGDVGGVNMWVCNDNEAIELERAVDSAFNRIVDKLRTMEPVVSTEMD